jgi:hypothetical protein
LKYVTWRNDDKLVMCHSFPERLEETAQGPYINGISDNEAKAFPAVGLLHYET